MPKLTDSEYRILLYIVRNRLRYEAGRQKRLNQEGFDIQNEKVRELAALEEKLEIMRLET